MRSPHRIALLLLAGLVLAALPAAAANPTPAPTQPVARAAQPSGCAPAADSAAPAANLAAALRVAQAPACSTQTSATEATTPLPAAIDQARPPFTRYCKCGCGITCETDADCGPGGQCVQFVTCC